MAKLDYMLGSRVTQHYQPIVDMKSLELVRYEALLRPIGFAIDTETLVRKIERSGDIRELDLWSLNSAIDKIELEGNTSEIAINLSARSICDPLFCKEVEWILEKKKHSTNVGFELTESEPIYDMCMASYFIKMVRERSCKVGLDDFGTGNSRFDVAKDLELDYIKISSRLTTAFLTNDFAHSIILRLASRSKDHGLTLVAEHIDNKSQYMGLRAIGIDHGQGWLFGAAESEINNNKNYSKEAGVSTDGDKLVTMANVIPFSLEKRSAKKEPAERKYALMDI